MTSSHAAKSFLYVAADDQFYQVGNTQLDPPTTLTPGSNATAKSVADVLSQLNSDLADKLDFTQYTPTSDSLPSAYALGLTFMSNGSTDAGYPERYSMGITIKYSSARIAQLWFGRSGKVYYRYSDSESSWLTTWAALN